MFKKVLLLVIFGVGNFSALFGADRYANAPITPPSLFGYSPNGSPVISFNEAFLYEHPNAQIAINPETQIAQGLEKEFARSRSATTMDELNKALSSLKYFEMNHNLANFDTSMKASIAAEIRRLEAARNELYGAENARARKRFIDRRSPDSGNRKKLFPE